MGSILFTRPDSSESKPMPADQPPASGIPEPPGDIGGGKKRADDPQPDRKIITNPHEDLQFFDDLAFEETFGDPSGMTLGMKAVTTLVIIAAIIMVGYLILLVIYPDQFGPEDWIGAEGAKKTARTETMGPLKGFELGGIHLGLPADEALKVYPSMAFQPNPGGGRIGAYRHHEGEYRVLFHGLEKSTRAWRIDSRHVFTKISYLELLGDLSQRYGQPTQSGCGAEERIIAIQCELFWQYPTFSLSARIKTTVSDDGTRASTALAVTAIDLRPDSFFAGLGAAKNLKRGLKEIGRPN